MLCRKGGRVAHGLPVVCNERVGGLPDQECSLHREEPWELSGFTFRKAAWTSAASSSRMR